MVRFVLAAGRANQMHAGATFETGTSHLRDVVVGVSYRRTGLTHWPSCMFFVQSALDIPFPIVILNRKLFGEDLGSLVVFSASSPNPTKVSREMHLRQSGKAFDF